MRLCASSTLSVETAARAALGLVGMARSLGGARALLHGASDSSGSGHSDQKTSQLLAFLLMPSRYRIGEAAAMLGVSADTVRRMIDRGDLRSRRTTGGQRLIAAVDIAALLASRSRREGKGLTGESSARNRLAGIVTRVVKDRVAAQ